MKKLSDKTLTNKLDNAFRELLQKRTKAKRCFVCGLQTDWFNPKTNPHGLQVGHFISRKVYALRWDFDNCFPQCSACNKRHEYNTLPFTQAILREYGADHVDRLHTRWQLSKQKAKTFNRAEKLELLESLKNDIEFIDGLQEAIKNDDSTL